MTRKFLHEQLYRGVEDLERLGQPQLVLCGAGALGSHLADNLVRQGFRKLRVIDRDRVEEHNISTQLYAQTEIGGWKVEVLRNRLFRGVEVEIDAVAKEMSDRNVRSLLQGAAVVIDTFDNAASRQSVQDFCRQANVVCLHAGLHADYCEVIWDEQYRVPRDVAGDVCDYPLARNLVLLAVAIASETLVRYVLEGQRENRSATLKDLSIQELESPTRLAGPQG